MTSHASPAQLDSAQPLLGTAQLQEIHVSGWLHAFLPVSLLASCSMPITHLGSIQPNSCFCAFFLKAAKRPTGVLADFRSAVILLVALTLLLVRPSLALLSGSPSPSAAANWNPKNPSAATVGYKFEASCACRARQVQVVTHSHTQHPCAA